MERTEARIAGTRCHLYAEGSGGPALYWGAMAGGDAQREAVAGLLSGLMRGGAFTLVCFEAEDWNRDLSPWAADGVRPGETFGGGGARTLNWLTQACIPCVEARWGAPGARLIGGYSLSGLFALWALYESGRFEGAASCSGSLWFPGWMDYAASRRAPMGSRVYLSLGTKEERTRNAAMAAVGEATRRMHERLSAEGDVARTALVWHPGGHFSQVEQRIAQGFAWLMA